jgi:hypothetical protein
MNFTNVKNTLLCLSLSVLLMACDSSSSTPDTAKRGLSALAKITAYADDNKNPKPTLEDYQNAGITGVTTSNLASVNKSVDALEGNDVDTTSELQTVVIKVNAEKPTTKPTAVPDTTKPVITLLGNTSIELAKNSSYSDAGATATDNIDGNISNNIVVINTVDSNKLGRYTVSYNVKDSARNAAIERTRIVKVINTAPTLTGIANPNTEIYTYYQFLPKAVDGNNDTLTFSIQNKPSWASFNTATGLLEGSVSQGSEGIYADIIISVSDGIDTTSLAPFSIQIDSAIDVAHKWGLATQGTDSAYSYYAPASNVLDNDDATYNHTSGGVDGKNWVQIQLPKPTNIKKVVIQARSNNTFRLKDAKVYLSDTPYNPSNSEALNKNDLVHTLLGNDDEQVITTDKSANYLIIKGVTTGSESDNNHLHLTKVEVYGTTPSEPVFLSKNNVTIDKWHNKTASIFQVEVIDYQDDTLSYSLDGLGNNVPFRIDADGKMYVDNLLNEGDYTFNVVVNDGINEITQSMRIEVLADAIVDSPFRTNDNQPQLSGYLPNIYKDGDTVSIIINGKTYQVILNNGRWELADDAISPPLEIGTHDITLVVNGTEVPYTDYFEVYGERLQHSTQTLTMNTIADIAVTVTSATVTPLVKDERVRGNSIKLYTVDGVLKLQNKSYRKIASLLAKYEDGNGDDILVKLTFSENIKPYSDNNLGAFAHDSEMTIVTTANHFNSEFSFGVHGDGDCTTATNETVNYCTPTTVNDTVYSDTAVQNDALSEQQRYSITLATYNHFYNSIDGLKAMNAWVYKDTYKDLDFTGNNQAIDAYIDEDEDKNHYLYRHFYNNTMPEHHVRMTAMRYQYSAEGRGSLTNPIPLIGSETSSGWASLWEGSLNLGESDDYEHILHEIGHAYSNNHDSGMTYGWAHAFRQVADTLYTLKEFPVVNVPKYVFETKRISNTQTKIIVHKTAEATKNEITFELLSSELLINNDFVISPLATEENGVMLTSNGRTLSRIYIRAYADDSKELMSQALTPGDMIQTYLFTDTKASKEYHAITHENWKTMASTLNEPLQPSDAETICQSVLGSNALLVTQEQADQIDSDYRSEIENAIWLNSKNLLGRRSSWWQYNAYDYSNNGYTKTWKELYDAVDDDTLGLLCVKDSEKVILTESTKSIPTLQACTTEDLVDRATRIKVPPEAENTNQYALVFPSKVQTTSTMRYCPSQVSTLGSAFEIDYVDPGGSGMDGYVNGAIGGIQKSGKWYSGNLGLTGMPVLLSELDDSMILQWKTSQENALDEGDDNVNARDKWMASINLIFSSSPIGQKPENSERDYDLVIEGKSHNFTNDTVDVTEGEKRVYFAKHKDGSLRTFNIVVAGKTYRYAVRYKYHYSGGGDQDNKVHIKYIPINEENVPPYLNHSVKAFIDNTREFIQYANMPEDARNLANEKVALPSLYLKSIAGGYEVYSGESTLRNDLFRIMFE